MGPEQDAVVVAHSSDLHLGDDHGGGGDLAALHDVIGAARDVSAHVLVLAGDIFDHNRLKLELLDRTTAALGEAGFPVVILPGNHDPLTPNSVYLRGGLSDPDNVSVLGISADDVVHFPQYELSVWGRAHLDGNDMSPLSKAPARSSRHQIVTAHGHFVSGQHDLHRSWLIHEDQLADLDADYVALGHWDVPQAVAPTGIPAYYSGSPDQAKTINVITFDGDSPAAVWRHPLHLPVASSP